MSNFITENNLTIKSYNGLREQLKPSWRGILKPENKLIPLTVEKTNKLIPSTSFIINGEN